MPHPIIYNEQLFAATEEIEWAVQDAIARKGPNSPLKNARYVKVYKTWHTSPGDPRLHITFTAYGGSGLTLNNYHGYHSDDPLNNAEPSQYEMSENWNDDKESTRPGAPLNASASRPFYQPAPLSMGPPMRPPMEPSITMGRLQTLSIRGFDFRSSNHPATVSRGSGESRSSYQQISASRRPPIMKSNPGGAPMYPSMLKARSHSDMAGRNLANSSNAVGRQSRLKADGSILRQILLSNMHQSNAHVGSVINDAQNGDSSRLINGEMRQEPLGQRSFSRRSSVLDKISEEQGDNQAPPQLKNGLLEDEWTVVNSTRSTRRNSTREAKGKATANPFDVLEQKGDWM